MDEHTLTLHTICIHVLLCIGVSDAQTELDSLSREFADVKDIYEHTVLELKDQLKQKNMELQDLKKTRAGGTAPPFLSAT